MQIIKKTGKLPQFIREAQQQQLIERIGIPETLDYDTYYHIKTNFFETTINWERNLGSDAPQFPYQIEIEDRLIRLRINKQAPQVSRYTLIINEIAIFSFDNFSEQWEFE